MVNAQDEEGSGTTGAEAVGFNVVRWYVGDVVDSTGSVAQLGSDVTS